MDDKKRITKIDILPITKDYLQKLKLEVAMKEKSRVSDNELLRRIANIPSLKDTLLRDAELKFRKRKVGI